MLANAGAVVCFTLPQTKGSMWSSGSSLFKRPCCGSGHRGHVTPRPGVEKKRSDFSFGGINPRCRRQFSRGPCISWFHLESNVSALKWICVSI